MDRDGRGAGAPTEMSTEMSAEQWRRREQLLREIAEAREWRDRCAPRQARARRRHELALRHASFFRS